jgi:hypothetical protein
MSDDPIANIRGWMEALLQMADEIEADADRLERERRNSAGSAF